MGDGAMCHYCRRYNCVCDQSQDEILGLYGNPTSITPFRPSPRTHNCGDCLAEGWTGTGIFVTSIVPPEQGWTIAIHCPICKETTFLLSPYAIKPERGDYWIMNQMCANDAEGGLHNMQLAIPKREWKTIPLGDK
jgi:hypothetical protein